MSTVSPLEALSPLAAPASSAQVSQRSMPGSVKGTMDQAKHSAVVAPVMDLLDGLSSNPSSPGIEVLNGQCTVYTLYFLISFFALVWFCNLVIK